ncbi:MAG: hypothetical protein GEU87_18015 [Alphaproteobacteria bacterium]|nr:hypothetical protein [Alphaproteobacteria bacterium]
MAQDDNAAPLGRNGSIGHGTDATGEQEIDRRQDYNQVPRRKDRRGDQRLDEGGQEGRDAQVPEGCKPYYALPVFSRHQGRLIVCFVRRFVESAQRFPERPRLSRSQMDALEMVSELATRPEFRLDITFDPGDIQFVNNLTTMHSRTGYEDYPEPERKRHLLRLWLAVPGGWPLPKAFYERYRATTPSGRPAGVVAMSEDGVTPLDVA